MNRVILHMDMDAFYAAVEQLDRPELRGRPVIVGGTSRRGVVSTASYEARQYGVGSAMPAFEAKRRLPHGVFLPVRMDRYREVSGEVMEVLQGFTPRVEQVSIDEAYLDLSGTERLYGPPEAVARAVKREILVRTRLTCSVGIAPNRFLAKIASDMDKPDGLTLIQPEDVDRFLSRLPIRKAPGIGAKTAERLEGLGSVEWRTFNAHLRVSFVGCSVPAGSECWIFPGARTRHRLTPLEPGQIHQPRGDPGPGHVGPGAPEDHAPGTLPGGGGAGKTKRGPGKHGHTQAPACGFQPAHP